MRSQMLDVPMSKTMNVQKKLFIEEVPGHKKKNSFDKKSNFTSKAKSVPVTQNMAITDADPALVIKWKNLSKWPLPCQMVFFLKPLTQVRQNEDDENQDYRHKSRLVICSNFASWGEHSTATNLDAPSLRLMLSLSSSPDTARCSIDNTKAFLNADIREDDTVLVTPPPILVKMDIVKPNTVATQSGPVWHVKNAIYGLREAPPCRKRETRSFVNSNSATKTSSLI